jgi:hypothetical protein
MWRPRVRKPLRKFQVLNRSLASKYTTHKVPKQSYPCVSDEIYSKACFPLKIVVLFEMFAYSDATMIWSITNELEFLCTTAAAMLTQP